MEVLQQFRFRYWLLGAFSEGYTLHEDDFQLKYEWKSIINGYPILKGGDKESTIEPTYYFTHDLSKNMLSGCEAISGINFQWMTNLPHLFEAHGLTQLVENQSGDLFKYKLKDSTDKDVNFVALPKKRLMDGEVWVSLNLRLYSDEELVAVLKHLLPDWRAQIDIDEPSPSIGKRSAIKKLVSYKVIEYLDLLLWSKASEILIPHKIMVLALFPNGEKGEVEFTQTILPFVKMVIQDNYRWLEELENRKDVS